MPPNAVIPVALGSESIDVRVTVEATGVGPAPLVGDVSGTFGDCFIAGDVDLTGDLIVEGLLTGIDTFTLEGNGFQLLFQNGGRPELAGVEKPAWVRWGDPVVGWQVGDRLAVAPTAVGVYVPSETTWQGSWAATTRPANSSDVTLVDGSIARPEVVNLTQTIVFQNLRRIHFHEGAGVASMKWLKILNCGTTGVLADYPLHFHLCGESVRGSLIEGVVVEGGKNHAFVPHGSHGITQRDCAAYNTKGNAFWWDLPVDDPLNRTNDLVWDRCLAMLSVPSPAAGETVRLTGFSLGSGDNTRCVRSVATCIRGVLIGPRQTSGFHWPEGAGSVWDFRECLAHNNGNSGIFTWQNSQQLHVVEDFVAYHNALAGVNHGAYKNVYRYSRMVLTGNGAAAVIQHAKTRPDGTPQSNFMLFEDIETDGPLVVTVHNSDEELANLFRRCAFPSVAYGDLPNKISNESQAPPGSYNIFEDCGLTPTEFDLAGINVSSIIEIREGAVLVHRWAAGVWT